MTRHPTFVHLTDLHLSHPDLNDPHLRADTVAALALAVETIGRIDPRPDFVILGGDLTNRGEPESYRLLREMTEGLGLPLVHALGNHDSRPAFYREVLGEDRDGPCCHDRVIAGLHVIVLDTSVPGRVGGAIGADQFAFLRAALDRAPGLPKIVVAHHPPRLDHGGLVWEALGPGDTGELAETLRGRGVAGIFCGHIHMNRVDHWHGIPLIVTGGLHATVDVLLRSGMRILEGTGFGLCVLRPSGLGVTFVPLTPHPRLLGEISEDRLRSFT